ncbi:MAG: hypothetical protein NTZ54_09625 [Alphaproteobacteria bacterium]|nr:hypothetical protein [Alphaproteobacteria bacterium]
MTFSLAEFNKKIAEVGNSISQALEGMIADDQLFALRDLILAQVRVCLLHYKLMEIEKDDRLVLGGSAFSSVMNKHLELAKFFRSLPQSAQKPIYEMESTISLYKSISHHFEEGGSLGNSK